MTYQFTEREMKFLRMLAHGRCAIKDLDNPNRPSRIIYGNTRYEADLMGIMGEYAVSKYLGIPFDTSLSVEGDGGVIDLMLGNYNIQVKSTKYRTGRLIFFRKEEINADLFVLCTVLHEHCTANIVGWIGQAMALEVVSQIDLGRGLRWVIEQRHLLPPSDLLKIKTDSI